VAWRFVTWYDHRDRVSRGERARWVTVAFLDVGILHYMVRAGAHTHLLNVADYSTFGGRPGLCCGPPRFRYRVRATGCCPGRWRGPVPTRRGFGRDPGSPARQRRKRAGRGASLWVIGAVRQHPGRAGACPAARSSSLSATNATAGTRGMSGCARYRHGTSGRTLLKKAAGLDAGHRGGWARKRGAWRGRASAAAACCLVARGRVAAPPPKRPGWPRWTEGTVAPRLGIGAVQGHGSLFAAIDVVL